MLWQRDVCWKSTGWQWGPQLRNSIPTKCSTESLKLFDSGIGLQSVDEIPTRYIDIDTIYKYSHDVDILWIILFCIPYKFVFRVSVLFRNCSFCFLGFHVYFFIVIKSIFEISLISILGLLEGAQGQGLDVTSTTESILNTIYTINDSGSKLIIDLHLEDLHIDTRKALPLHQVLD